MIKSEKKPPQTSLADAEVVVAAGRRAEQGDLAMLEELAELLGGQLGVTRPLVEAGWAGHTDRSGSAAGLSGPNS